MTAGRKEPKSPIKDLLSEGKLPTFASEEEEERFWESIFAESERAALRLTQKGAGTKRKPLPLAEVIARTRAALEKLAGRIPVHSAYIYGSYAAGRPQPWSDVDIAVVSPAFGENIIADTALLLEAFEGTVPLAEPRAYSIEELEAAYPGTFLHDEVLGKGIRVYPSEGAVQWKTKQRSSRGTYKPNERGAEGC